MAKEGSREFEVQTINGKTKTKRTASNRQSERYANNKQFDTSLLYSEHIKNAIRKEHPWVPDYVLGGEGEAIDAKTLQDTYHINIPAVQNGIDYNNGTHYYNTGYNQVDSELKQGIETGANRPNYTNREKYGTSAYNGRQDIGENGERLWTFGNQAYYNTDAKDMPGQYYKDRNGILKKGNPFTDPQAFRQNSSGEYVPYKKTKIYGEGSNNRFGLADARKLKDTNAFVRYNGGNNQDLKGFDVDEDYGYDYGYDSEGNKYPINSDRSEMRRMREDNGKNLAYGNTYLGSGNYGGEFGEDAIPYGEYSTGGNVRRFDGGGSIPPPKSPYVRGRMIEQPRDNTNIELARPILEEQVSNEYLETLKYPKEYIESLRHPRQVSNEYLESLKYPKEYIESLRHQPKPSRKEDEFVPEEDEDRIPSPDERDKQQTQEQSDVQKSLPKKRAYTSKGSDWNNGKYTTQEVKALQEKYGAAQANGWAVNDDTYGDGKLGYRTARLFDRNLEFINGKYKSEAAKEIQDMLISQGYLPAKTSSGKSNADGWWGKKTDEAFKKFCASKGIDGIEFLKDFVSPPKSSEPVIEDYSKQYSRIPDVREGQEYDPRTGNYYRPGGNDRFYDATTGMTYNPETGEFFKPYSYGGHVNRILANKIKR